MDKQIIQLDGIVFDISGRRFVDTYLIIVISENSIANHNLCRNAYKGIVLLLKK
jgi:hypothetical protein